MFSSADTVGALRASPRAVARQVRDATSPQIVVAVAAALLVGVAIGLATVLIPNTLFSREIPPTAWDVPVLVATAALSGLLAATYVRGPASRDEEDDDPRGGSVGVVGVVLSWFAVGCPVCNKIALLAFGYAGAQTWFAGAQPILAAVGLALLWIALAVRLHNASACPAPVTGGV